MLSEWGLRVPGDGLGLIPDLDQDSIVPPIIHVFTRLSRIKGPRTNRALILW